VAWAAKLIKGCHGAGAGEKAVPGKDGVIPALGTPDGCPALGPTP
jgi:hypothetical protein